MPSSPTFTDYQRSVQRFFYGGISLMPQDALPANKIAWALNLRSYEEGTLTVRDGLDLLTDGALPDPAVSLFRLNDTSLYNGGVDAIRLRATDAGALYAGTPTANVYGSIDTGYSGEPLSAVVASPLQSPRPWIYLADSARMRKVDTTLDLQQIGIPQPLSPPSAVLAAPQLTFLNTIGVAAWVAYGGTTVFGAVTGRVSTLIDELLYDTGTTGNASVSLVDMDNVTEGMTIDLGTGSTETVIVDTVHPAVSPTTIGAIIYDVGTSGLCTIQPDTGFSVGQIEAPYPEQIRRRYADLNLPLPPRVSVNRTVDFPVNSLILLGGIEVVRILSVAVGQDGVQSFRCSTTNTFVATNTISGISSFRTYLNTTKAVGDGATAQCVQVTMTPGSTAAEAGGIQSPMTGGERNWGLVGNRATQPDDIIAFGIQISQFAVVESVRLMLNVSDDTGGGGSDFLHNYYQYEWRASDLRDAVQSGSPTATGLMSTAQSDAVYKGLVDALYRPQFGQNDSVDSDVVLGSGSQPKYLPRTQAELNRRASNVPADGYVSTGGTPPRQLDLGDNQWMTLHCRVGDLVRIGTDATLTLNVILGAAMVVQVAGTTTPIVINVSDCYLRGGFGPDVGPTNPPYVYRYRYRDTVTGARSNVSPPMRAGVYPRRGRVQLSGAASGYSSSTVVDWFRFGGAMAKWAYTGTSVDGAPPTYNDDNSDSYIDGGEIPRVDLFQPWPVSDLPRSGTCRIAGTAVVWESGDTFDTRWSPDSGIIINGFATSLYTSPASTTQLTVIDNVGQGTAIPFSLPSPTILAQPMRILFGGPINGAWFNFGCGDVSDPGSIRWTNGNDPDTASDRNYLVVSTASDPLMNGWIDDAGTPFVFSSQQLYRLIPTFGSVSDFVAVDTACNEGLWAPWAFCTSKYGTFFLTNNGISVTQGGSPAQSITDPDLKPLFPSDGTTSDAIRNLAPVDLSLTSRLRLAMVGDYLYFDYVDVNGIAHTLVYEPKYQRWTPDFYTPGVQLRLAEPGPQVLTHMVEGADGNLYQYSNDKTSDGLIAVPYALWTPWANGSDARQMKQWGDSVLDMNPGTSFGGVEVTPVVDNGNVALATQVLGAGDTLRATYIVNTGTPTDTGYGVLSRNYGLLIQGECQSCDVARPIFYLWEPAFLFKQTPVSTRATDWEDLGYKGAKFVQGVVIRANTFGEDVDVAVQYDGPNGSPQTALTFTINHDGEQSIAYPLSAAGWTPFVGELVRLKSSSSNVNEWTLIDWRFVWEPAPELATQWETQFTTFGYPGFLDVHDGIIAYSATAPITWLVEYQDGDAGTYTLPASSGSYFRTRQITQAQKGKAVRFRWTSDEPFRLFKKDCAVRIQGWGVPGGYQSVNPFGGPHFVDGAGI